MPWSGSPKDILPNLLTNPRQYGKVYYIRENNLPQPKGVPMTEIQWIPQTERDFLASVTGEDGKPLAIAGARGRFSRAATEALAKARSEGFGFIGDKGHPMTEVKTPKAPKAPKTVVSSTPKPAETEQPKTVTVPAQTTPSVDAKAVRAWAKTNGHTVGERGRIRPEVISAYLAGGGKVVTAAPKAAQAQPKPVRVRTQTVAYGRVRRGDLPKHISEPVLAITNCFRCRKTVSYCGCADGVQMPKWAGGESAVFSKTEAK
jgi:hypothetical protein